jgi:hypothetical protein
MDGTHLVSSHRRVELFPHVRFEVAVFLHIYDYQGAPHCHTSACCRPCPAPANRCFSRLAGAVMITFNFLLAHSLGLGLYHSGVEVGGREFSFSAAPAAPAASVHTAADRRNGRRNENKRNKLAGGVSRMRPRNVTRQLPHAYRSTVPLGVAHLSQVGEQPGRQDARRRRRKKTKTKPFES